ncbi:MAG: hypothetical protein LKI92_10750 [Schleiferilactobacillus harbinensis]|jgi:hypothetical protein|nr:hypothetical protein [Schleiferilactobacillus harbinensis]MCI1913702.1 hypothetical protein [Schleiferilactobacillus harbinensis]
MASERNKTMFEQFELEGIWSSTKDSDINKWDHGVLHYSPTGIELDIVGSLNKQEDDPFHLLEGGDYDLVYGYSVSGDYVMLSNVLAFGGRMNFPGMSTEKYSVSNALIYRNEIKSSSLPIVIKAAQFSFTNLNTWLPNRMLEIQIRKDNTRVYVENPPRQFAICHFSKFGKTISLSINERGTTRPLSGGISGVRIENESRFSLNAEDQPLLISEVKEIVNDFGRLFSVLFGKSVSVKYVRANTAEEAGMNLLFSQNYKVNTDETTNKNRLVPSYDIVKNFLPTFISNWFAMSEEMRLLVDDYLLTITQRGVIENSLINLMQGVESYYRNEELSLVKKIAKITKSVPISILDRKQMESRLGNEQDYTRKLKNTRVFLTHGNKRDDLYTGKEMISATVVFQLIVQCFVLLQLGMDTNSLSYMKSVFAERFNTKYFNNDVHF